MLLPEPCQQTKGTKVSNLEGLGPEAARAGVLGSPGRRGCKCIDTRFVVGFLGLEHPVTCLNNITVLRSALPETHGLYDPERCKRYTNGRPQGLERSVKSSKFALNGLGVRQLFIACPKS